MNKTGANGPRRQRLANWLANQGTSDQPGTTSALPVLPALLEADLNRRGVVHLKPDDDALARYYEGPIDVGMVFAWEPDLPWAREMVIVCEVATVDGDERRIWTLCLNSPMRGQHERWRAAMRHVGRDLLIGAPTWNDEGRFREAVVPTFFRPQTP